MWQSTVTTRLGDIRRWICNLRTYHVWTYELLNKPFLKQATLWNAACFLFFTLFRFSYKNIKRKDAESQSFSLRTQNYSQAHQAKASHERNEVLFILLLPCSDKYFDILRMGGIRIRFSSLVAFDWRAWSAFLHSTLFCCRLPLPPIRNGNHIGITWESHGTCFGRFRAISCPRILFSWVQNYQIPNWRLGLSMS